MDGRSSSPTGLLMMELAEGSEVRRIAVERLPFAIGRATGCDLVLPFGYISRVHAELVEEEAGVVLRDRGSRHGTFVNGERVERRVLRPGDSVQLGSLDSPRLRLVPQPPEQTTARELETQLQGLHAGRSDLEKLLWFLEAAQELNSAGKVDRVLASLLDTTLALAGMERGFVFLRNEAGALELALGLDAGSAVLKDSSTVSHTVLHQAAEGTDQYVLTDTLAAAGNVAESILAHNLRTILCIPLRQTRESRHTAVDGSLLPRPVFGVLYLDSSFQPEMVSDVDHELLRTIAREAAALVENARLAVMEDQARQQKEELQVAARIQQGLMAVQIPSFPFAKIQARSIACHDVGGDFFDVIPGDNCVHLSLVDVSGKGVSAAILASTLQGMLFMQLGSGEALGTIAAAINRYLCTKNVGKYATMVLARLHRDGAFEYVNCGHIEPRVCIGDSVRRLAVSNLPVGLLAHAEYQAETIGLGAGDRVVIVSDGFTEAEDSAGEFFGEERFDQAIRCSEIQDAIGHMMEFCAGQPANDDVTIVQLRFSGLEKAGEAMPE